MQPGASGSGHTPRTEEEVVIGDEVRVALQGVLLEDEAQVDEAEEGQEHLCVRSGFWVFGCGDE